MKKLFLVLLLFGIGIVGFSISATATDSDIPEWVKNNAKWWSNGQIDDNSFVEGIQFLIKEGLIKIPITEQNIVGQDEIPDWVKNNAGWWADDLISETDFVKGIEFLASQGIIKVN